MFPPRDTPSRRPAVRDRAPAVPVSVVAALIPLLVVGLLTAPRVTLSTILAVGTGLAVANSVGESD